MFSGKNRRKQLLRTVFDRYVIINLSTHPHEHCATRHTNKNLRNAIADVYGAPPQNATSQRKQLLHAVFDSYVLNHSTIRSHDRISTLHINNKHQNSLADAYRPPPSSSISLLFPQRYPNATTPHYALLRPTPPHPPPHLRDHHRLHPNNVIPLLLPSLPPQLRRKCGRRPPPRPSVVDN